jgi:hypothetical protein
VQQALKDFVALYPYDFRRYTPQQGVQSLLKIFSGSMVSWAGRDLMKRRHLLSCVSLGRVNDA